MLGLPCPSPRIDNDKIAEIHWWNHKSSPPELMGQLIITLLKFIHWVEMVSQVSNVAHGPLQSCYEMGHMEWYTCQPVCRSINWSIGQSVDQAIVCSISFDHFASKLPKLVQWVLLKSRWGFIDFQVIWSKVKGLV